MDSLVITGIKHSGKSTLGRIVSEKLGFAFYDTDDVIEKLTGKTPRKIYSEDGREAFLKAELESCMFIKSVHEKTDDIFVIATGGGICTNDDAVHVLKEFGTFCFLDVSEEIAFGRIKSEISFGSDGRLQNLPAYIAKKNPRSLEEAGIFFSEFYSERTNLYKKIADFTVQPVLLKHQSAEKIIELWRANQKTSHTN